MTSLPHPAEAGSALDVQLGVEVKDWVETKLGSLDGTSNRATARVDVLLGVGVDMVDTAELADMIESSGSTFIDLCWTPAEQDSCAGSTPKLAARWAAKEATMKALGHGIGELDPVDIEVVSIEGEPPLLQLHGSAEARARERRVSRVALSLTHEGTYAVAFVVAMSEMGGPKTDLAPGLKRGKSLGS